MLEAELLDAQQLADYLRVPLATVYQWNSRGGGPASIRIGRHVRYRRSDIEAWLEERTTRRP